VSDPPSTITLTNTSDSDRVTSFGGFSEEEIIYVDNDKKQILSAVLHEKWEVVYENKTDILDMSYYFDTKTIDVVSPITENINVNNDIFELKQKYNENYWKDHNILPLTDEMQMFINKVNSIGKNSDFKTKTNIKK
jgi:hypothetical protein